MLRHLVLSTGFVAVCGLSLHQGCRESRNTSGKVHLIWGDEDIDGRLRKSLDTRKGASEKLVGLGGGAPKICILQNKQVGGLLKKLNRYRGGLLKLQASSFSIFIPTPLVILNKLSPRTKI